MADLKTKQTGASVEEFLNSIENETKRKDSFTILNLMKQASGMEPKMWGSSMIGFGNYHYKYESGHEGDAFQFGFSPRKQNLVLYLPNGSARYQELLQKLGKHKTGKACLYINKLSDVDFSTLNELVELAVEEALKKPEYRG